MTTNALEYHLEGFYKMYNSPHSRPQRFNIISAEEHKALKMLVLAETTALFDFLLTKVGLDPGVLAELSVTPARAVSVNERFTELISDTWPRIRERIRFCLASINGILPSDVTGNSIESWYATRVNRAWPTKIPCLLMQARFEERNCSYVSQSSSNSPASCAHGGWYLQDWLQRKLRELRDANR
jgi:hypothetical protein